MLRPFAHPVACCCVLLRKVWNQSNFWANHSQHFFCFLIAEAQHNNVGSVRTALPLRHARALHMVSKVLWVVPFPRCTAGPNIVSLVWIGNRLLVWKKGQHLTRAWLTIKRTISWIPNKEAQNPTSRYKIFGESRFPGSCKISYPNKKSCIFPNPAQYFGQFPDPENTLQTLFGCWWLISVSAHKWQVLWCFCFTVHCPSRLLFGAMLFKT